MRMKPAYALCWSLVAGLSFGASAGDSAVDYTETAIKEKKAAKKRKPGSVNEGENLGKGESAGTNGRRGPQVLDPKTAADIEKAVEGFTGNRQPGPKPDVSEPVVIAADPDPNGNARYYVVSLGRNDGKDLRDVNGKPVRGESSTSANDGSIVDESVAKQILSADKDSNHEYRTRKTIIEGEEGKKK